MGKDRLRNTNKEKYKKRQKEKTKRTLERAKQQQSREYRNRLRRDIKMYSNRYRDLRDRHILIVLKDTGKTERILLQKNKIDNGKSTLLTLPIITEEMIETYLDVEKDRNEVSNSTDIANVDDTKRIGDMIKYFFGVESSDISVDPKTPLLICKDCKLLLTKDDLCKVTVKPYDRPNWYRDGVFTTQRGLRVYNGTSLKDIFVINGMDLKNTYVYQDTVMELALYKGWSEKEPMGRIVEDAIVFKYRKSGLGLRELTYEKMNKIFNSYGEYR